MRPNLSKYVSLEDNNFTTDKPTEVVKDESAAVDVSEAAPADVAAASDNSSTIKIDTQNEDPAQAEETAQAEELEKVKEDLVPKKKMVFLGGTCNESTWRDKLIEGLEISYFNPVVQDWTKDDKEKEDQIKDSADYNLFVFTPKHTGFFSFVEATLLAVKSSSRTVLCVLQDDDGTTFDEATKRSVDSTLTTLAEEGVKVFDSLDAVRTYLNGGEAQEAPIGEPEVKEAAPVEGEAAVTPTETTNTADVSTKDAGVTVKVDTGEEVATEGLGTTLSTWSEGKRIAKEMSSRTSGQYVTALRGYDTEMRATVKNSSWWNGKDKSAITVRLNFIDFNRFCRNYKLASNPIDELLKETLFLKGIADKYVNNIKTFTNYRTQVIRELASAKDASAFNEVCAKWNKKLAAYPADEWVGKPHAFMNDVGTVPIAYAKAGYTLLNPFPFWTDKKANQGDIVINGKADIDKLITIITSSIEMITLVENVDKGIPPEGFSFNKQIVNLAYNQDPTQWKKMLLYLSWDYADQWATIPMIRLKHYFGTAGESAYRVIKKYEKEVH